MADPAPAPPPPDASQHADDDRGGAASAEVFSKYRATSILATAERAGVTLMVHPGDITESASLSAVPVPALTYPIFDAAALRAAAASGALSDLQFEGVTLAAQRHTRFLPPHAPGAQPARAGFILADSTGVGKGRQIAGIIVDGVARGLVKHVWVSTSADLIQDARRDLKALGCDVPVFDGRDMKRAPSNPRTPCVMFMTYSTLAMPGTKTRGRQGPSRLEQVVAWCGGGKFEGVMCFDEAHKAKNFSAPSSGARAGSVGGGTKTARAVVDVQTLLPGARVVYASATGVSEVSHMAYLTRVGLFGPGTPFTSPDGSMASSFGRFAAALKGRGYTFLEMLAQTLKSEGAMIARSLSYEKCVFSTDVCTLSEADASVYDASARLWTQILDAAKTQGNSAEPRARQSLIRLAYAAQSRFFKALTVSLKVPAVAAEAQKALAEGKAVVIGLQATGEAASTAAGLAAGQLIAAPPSTARDTMTGFIRNNLMTAEELAGLGDDDDDMPDAPGGDGGAGPSANPSGRPLRQAATAAREAFQGLVKLSSDDEGEGAARPRPRSAARRPTPQRAATPASHISLGSSDSSTSDESSSSEASSNDDESDDDDGTESDASGGPGRGKGKRRVKSASRAATPAARTQAPTATPPAAPSLTVTPDAEVKPDAGAVAAAAAPAGDAAAAAEPSAAPPANAAPPAAPPRLTHRQLLTAAEALPLPPAALDDLIDRLGGTEGVAELTGRKLRAARRGGRARDPTAPFRVESRGTGGVDAADRLNVVEARDFMSGRKLVAIISDAASTGVSLHADLACRNQRQRVHITLELPWAADKAMQQLGRSHRSSQASAPIYILAMTPLGGESRFASAVGRRLHALGALTRGDRRAASGSSSLGDSAMLDSPLGHAALRSMMASIGSASASIAALATAGRRRRGVVDNSTSRRRAATAAATAAATGQADASASLLPAGVTLRALVASVRVSLEGLPASVGADPVLAPLLGDVESAADQVAAVRAFHEACVPVMVEAGIEDLAKTGDVKRFLNRILAVRVAAQVALFSYFSVSLDAGIEAAKKAGSFDAGLTDVAVADAPLESVAQASALVQLGGARAPGRQGEAELVTWTDPLAGQVMTAHEVVVDRGLSAPAANAKLTMLMSGGLRDAVGASGFYTARHHQAHLSKYSIMLALARPPPYAGAAVTAYQVWRPNTGLRTIDVTAHDLVETFEAVRPHTALLLWEKAHGDTLLCQHGAGCRHGPDCRVGGRLTTEVLLTGPVTRAWGVLEEVLARAARGADNSYRWALRAVRATRPDGTSMAGVRFPGELVRAAMDALADHNRDVAADAAAVGHAADGGALAAAPPPQPVASVSGGAGHSPPEGGDAPADMEDDAASPAGGDAAPPAAAPPAPSPAPRLVGSAALPPPVVNGALGRASGGGGGGGGQSLLHYFFPKRERDADGGGGGGGAPSPKRAAVADDADVAKLVDMGLGDAAACRAMLVARGGSVTRVVDAWLAARDGAQ